MFDINEFYNQCNSGERINSTEIRKYIASFPNVIIWGAAGMGKAIGCLLESWNIQNLVYWDKRDIEIGSIGGRRIEKPFSSEYSHDKTLVIYSIPNHVIMSSLMRSLKKAGYPNIIRGDILYSGIICPYILGDRPSAKRCWMQNECRSVICKRLEMITRSREKEQKPGERIDLTYNCFIINSICNLNCTHCVQFINNYPEKTRGNIPTDIICRDIDLWLELVDSVGTISVMGGETFMHPDIAIIANKFSEHDNFGFVSFPTNGLFPIKEEQLYGIEDERIVIAFGYYKHVASNRQLEIYEKNIELVKKYNISYTESRYLPTWVVPSGLYKCTDDIQVMQQKKQACKMPPRNLQIREGRVHTCDRGVALYAMKHVDYPSDYYMLTENENLAVRRDHFREFVDRPYYYTCSHCEMAYGDVPSALQGKINVFDINSYKNKVWEKYEEGLR